MAADMVADQQELAAAGVPTDDVPVDLLRRCFALGPDGRWFRRPPATYFLAVDRGLRELDLHSYYARATCPTVTGLAIRRDQPTRNAGLMNQWSLLWTGEQVSWWTRAAPSVPFPVMPRRSTRAA